MSKCVCCTQQFEVCLSAASCSTLAVQQQRKICRRYVDKSITRQRCQTMKHAMWIGLDWSTKVSRSEMYSASTTCLGDW